MKDRLHPRTPRVSEGGKMCRLILTLSLMFLASSCSVMQPEGNLKLLSDGELFTCEPHAPMPADNTIVPDRDETDVSWRLGGF